MVVYVCFKLSIIHEETCSVSPSWGAVPPRTPRQHSYISLSFPMTSEKAFHTRLGAAGEISRLWPITARVQQNRRVMTHSRIPLTCVKRRTAVLFTGSPLSLPLSHAHTRTKGELKRDKAEYNLLFLIRKRQYNMHKRYFITPFPTAVFVLCNSFLDEVEN